MKKKMITVALALFAFIGVRAEEKETVQSPAFADLPSGYRQLEYIDTDGNQWVNTRFLPACTNAVEIKASFTNTTTGSDQYLFCTQRSTEGTDRRRFYLNITSKGKSEFGFRNSADGSASISPSVPHVFFAAPDKTDIYTEVEDAYFLTGYVDGIQAGNKVAGKDFTPTSQAYFCLFGRYTGSLTDTKVPDSRAVCRFWYFKVWETKNKANLLCYIIPVYGVKEEKIGFYDLVAERFLPVSGSPVPAGKYTLMEDEQWFDNKILLTSGMTIDLSGHNLTIEKAAPTIIANKVSPVDAEYQDLVYLTTLGGESIVIPGFRLPGTAKVEMKFRPNTFAKEQFLFSSRNSDKKRSYGALLKDDGTVRFDFDNPWEAVISTPLTDDEDHVLVFDGSGGPEGKYSTWTLDGVLQTPSALDNGFTSGGDLCLFNVGNDGANPAECRLYYFTVTTKDGKVSLDLHPVRRIADGAVGLYDRIGGVFYESTSSKAFAFPVSSMPMFVNSSEVDSELRVGRETLAYTVVDCITATGSQYIDTGYTPAATDRLEMRASLSELAISGLFYTRYDSKDRAFGALYYVKDGNGSFRFDFSKSILVSTIKATVNEPFTIAFDGNARKGYVDADECQHDGGSFTPKTRIYLFAMHTNHDSINYYAKGSIYYFKAVGADGTVKVDMIPVVRSDGAVGLYDRVRGGFYPSSSAAPFTAGSVVGDGNVNIPSDYVPADFYLGGAKIADNAKLKLVEGTVSGVVFEDGGAIDLSEFTGPFSLDENKVEFADGATVKVCLGTRKVLSTEPVISWSEAPANLDRIRFEFPCDDGTSAKGWKEDDGIYFRRYGLVISVK